MLRSTSAQTEKLLALSKLKGIGAKKLRSLSLVPNFEEYDLNTIIEKNLPNGSSFTKPEVNDALTFAKIQIDKAESNKHVIISPFDSHFPNSLKRMHDCPNILFVAGNVSELNGKNITIIGTREPSEHGIEIAKRITKWFAERTWNIVSGLAYGIDKLAHEQCISSGSKTIAVMAQGLEKVYPAKHKYLTERILDNGGTLISEYAYDSFSGKANFVQRDRIQSGLSAGVILIQSNLNGGSLHASRKSIEYERALIVAGQSKTDISSSIDCIQANMTLLNGSDKDVLKILKMNSFNQELLIKLLNANNLIPTEKVLIDINNVIREPYLNRGGLNF
ncbi:MAG: DNA-protecting protein DprA [Colwellia sp.]|nr:DNA-protecting protein DprA [Colwellia sp.]